MGVVVTGGTGLIGRALCKALLSSGRSVTVLTRRPDQAKSALPKGTSTLQWDGKSAGLWEKSVQHANVVVNLAGESIGGGRWTKKRKQKIMNSRLAATSALVRAMEQRDTGRHRQLLINASGKDFYGDRGNMTIDEKEPQGEGFLAKTCGAWEHAALGAEQAGAKVVLLRLGLVLEKGGALDQMMLPYRLFVGGTIGSGHQWVSWIHLTDVIGLILFLINKHENDDEVEDVSGPINATTPNPVTMRDFGRTLGQAIGRPSWFPVPSPILRLVLGEMADLMLVSQRALPLRAERLGFAFQFPELRDALENVVA